MLLRFLFYCVIITNTICVIVKTGATVNNKDPNIILILTDDQDFVLQGLFPMIQAQKHIALKGITFMNAFTSSPICCPSRASLLSGLYAHNTKTKNNSVAGGCYSNHWKSHIEPKSLPVQLKNEGYQTFFAGKYLNEYNSVKVPPGWTEFFGLHGNSKYYNYTLTENGKIKNYSDKYLTDLLNEKILNFLDTKDKTKPFFAMLTPPAPHEPFTPADRHNGSYTGTKALRTPNFNQVYGPLEKHWLVSSSKRIPWSVLETMDIYFQKRWESLLAVDEMIGNIINKLSKIKEIDNTYIILTSDNGYHIGQFAQPFDKRQPYETDIRVPFLIRGPNIQPKSISTYPVALIDLYPTILNIANIPLSGMEDGISFNKYLSIKESDYEYDKNYHRQILIEYWGEGNDNTWNPDCPYKRIDHLSLCNAAADCHCQDSWNNTYSCIRHFTYRTNRIYCEFKDDQNFVEIYDLQTDLYQIDNLGNKLLPSERALYSLALKNLTRCTGITCRETGW
ncbi:N-acetylglucosamine-6-sulfatase-like [Condylostylus longicornis]|uniref:N-acetylglucosamine-6-sulfatase-like n=1 Tax=Condylostylus longicornis TaxID=2530218 RepID=UPI00244E4565|nr:N-acetylglucosamine-6-sulfatase-like [Condylostylus longicornis]